MRLHYTKADVDKLLKEHNIPIEDFRNFIHGQGCPMVDGELCYFTWDVDRFIEYWEYGRELNKKGVKE